MKDSNAVAVDTSKNSFHMVGFNERGEVTGRRKLTRPGFKKWLVTDAPVKLYMEACGGAHYWGRYAQDCGHEAYLIAPQFVKPYRMGEKNDWNDAIAIGVAGRQGTMRYVGVKSEDQQVMQALHRVRSRVQRDRVALANQIRGLLGEHGIVVGKSVGVLKRQLPEVISDAGLPELLREIFGELYEELLELEAKLEKYTRRVERLAKTEPMCVELMKMPGIGPITATALVAEIADARVFRNGRQMSAYIGLVPRQFTTGGQVRLGPISKRGNVYLRKLLVHGARTVIRHLGNKQDRTSCWVRSLIERRGKNKATVALANKQARWAWCVMTQAVA